MIFGYARDNSVAKGLKDQDWFDEEELRPLKYEV